MRKAFWAIAMLLSFMMMSTWVLAFEAPDTVQGPPAASNAGTTNFDAASTTPLDHQSILGPLAGATINAFTLNDLSNPVEGLFWPTIP